MKEVSRTESTRLESLLFVSLFTLQACGGGGSSHTPQTPAENLAPIASPITRTSDPAAPFIEQALAGSDPDGDPIQFILNSPATGAGYKDAYVDPSGVLYATLTATTGQVTINYQVTDGALTSPAAAVTINLTATEANETGAKAEDPQTYSSFERRVFDGERSGNPGADATLPPSFDLSSAFPNPGIQGSQGSCVGWATAYALKSYQERLEEGWQLNTASTNFSPAYIYNQINDGQDNGSLISDALQLIIDKGVATWGSMPYSDSNYLQQPSVAAHSEAGNFKASQFATLTSVEQIKDAIVNRYPVVIMVKVYESFNNLSGANSVYNTFTGTYSGNHAVTVVGYDDARFGGSFKIINSWGQNWGDKGFFYLPYDKAPSVLLASYVLQDAPNGAAIEPYSPPPPSGLPNLTTLSWNANFDGTPGGTGYLQYEVVNEGSGTALAGANVSLVLTTNNSLSTLVAYLVYEEIPFDLDSGHTVYRDTNNQLNFTIPDVEDGYYYMGVWVDDLNEVEESDESDNFGPSSASSLVQRQAPDLSVDYWFAEWAGDGSGALEYTVSNSGGSAVTSSDWPLHLWLTESYDFSGDSYLLWEEPGPALAPGYYVYRDQNSAAPFNLFKDVNNNDVAPGEYLMVFIADPYNVVVESQEYNFSYSNGTIAIGSATAKAATSERQNTFNGKRLPPGKIMWERVRISKNASGDKSIQRVGTGPATAVMPTEDRARTHLHSKEHRVFPTTTRTAAPAIVDN